MPVEADIEENSEAICVEDIDEDIVVLPEGTTAKNSSNMMSGSEVQQRPSKRQRTARRTVHERQSFACR